MARKEDEKLTAERPPQSGSAAIKSYASTALRYPQLSVAVPVSELLRHSATTMANTPFPESKEGSLSESWTDVSDVENSIEDELHSETTDAASLVDHNGPDDVHSLDGRGSDGSDGGSVGTPDDGNIQQQNFGDAALDDSTRTVNHRMPYSGEPAVGIDEDPPPASRTQGQESWQPIQRLKTSRDINKDLGFPRQNPFFLRMLHDPQTHKRLSSDRPFRVLYFGSSRAKLEILAKLQHALACEDVGSGGIEDEISLQQKQIATHPEDATRLKDGQNSAHRKTSISLVDWTLATVSEDERGEERINVILEDGSACSSRWNGSAYEFLPCSGWMQPDLAIFLLDDGALPTFSKQQSLVYEIMTRHHVAIAVLSDAPDRRCYTSFLPSHQSNSAGQHLLFNAKAFHPSSRACPLPNNLNSFMAMGSHELNRSLVHCKRYSTGDDSITTSSFVAGAHGVNSKTFMDHRTKRASSDNLKETRPLINGFCLQPYTPKHEAIGFVGTIAPILMGSLVMTMVLAAFFAYSSFENPVISNISPHTTLSIEPRSHSTTRAKNGPLIHTATQAPPNIPSLDTTSLATRFTSSNVIDLTNNDPIREAGQSKRFHVENLGDGHLIVRTPKGLRSRPMPLDVKVTRDDRALDITVTHLFEDVYSVQVERSDAHGLLSVLIQPYKNAPGERHEIDCGSQWWRMAGFSTASEEVSQRVKSDANKIYAKIQSSASRFEHHLHDRAAQILREANRWSMRFRADTASFIQGECDVARVRATRIYRTACHEWEVFYDNMGKKADVVLENLQFSARQVDQQRWKAVELFASSVREASEHLTKVFLSEGPAELDKRVQHLIRSEYLATAQERAQQIGSDVATNFRYLKDRSRFISKLGR